MEMDLYNINKVSCNAAWAGFFYNFARTLKLQFKQSKTFAAYMFGKTRKIQLLATAVSCSPKISRLFRLIKK